MDNPRRRRLLVPESVDVGNDDGGCINWIVGPHDDGVMIDTTVRMLPTGRRGMLLFMATARVVARALRLVVLVAEAPRWLWYHHHHAMLMLMLIHVWHAWGCMVMVMCRSSSWQETDRRILCVCV